MPGFPPPWTSEPGPDAASGGGWPTDYRTLAYLAGQNPDSFARQRQRLAAGGAPITGLFQAMATARGWPAPDVATRAHAAKECLGLAEPRAETVYMPVVDEILGAYRLIPSIERLSRLYLLAPYAVAAIIETGRDLEDARCYEEHGLALGDRRTDQTEMQDTGERSGGAESSYRRESRAVRAVLAEWEPRCRALCPEDLDRVDAGIRAWRDACLGHRGAWVFRRPGPLMAYLDALLLLGVDVGRCLGAEVCGRFEGGILGTSVPQVTVGRATTAAGKGECELRVRPCGTPGLSYRNRFARCLMAAGAWRAASHEGAR